MVAPPDNFIEVNDLHKSIGPQAILRGVTLAIRRGETIVLVGRSGEGKSVLIKTLVGLITADSGSIKIEGQEIVGLTERELAPARRKVGILFQNGALFDSLTVAENVAFPLVEAGVRDSAVRREKVRESLDAVGLVDHLEKMPAHLSGGQRKRAALARAIISKPRGVLYDEPTAGLDPIATDSIDRLIRSIQQRYEVTSVVITHDLKSVERIADRVAFLREGRIYFLGSAGEFFASADPLLQDFIQGRSHDGES